MASKRYYGNRCKKSITLNVEAIRKQENMDQKFIDDEFVNIAEKEYPGKFAKEISRKQHRRSIPTELSLMDLNTDQVKLFERVYVGEKIKSLSKSQHYHETKKRIKTKLGFYKE